MKRLNESGSPLGPLLEAARELEDDDEVAAARRVRARLFSAPRPRAARWPWVAAAVAALLVLGLWGRGRPVPLEPAGEGAAVAWEWTAAAAATPDARRVEARRFEVGQGLFSARARGPDPVAVRTPAVELRATSAVFKVLVAPGGATTLLVEEGEVEVRGPASTVVRAGGRWESGAAADASAAVHRWALELEHQGQLAQALEVLGVLAEGQGVWGQLGLYDAARIEASQGPSAQARARARLAAYRQRFGARGALAREVAALEAQLGGE